MCGITGFLEFTERHRQERQSTLARMTARLEHRGPDDVGYWLNPSGQVALGHRRLSILDLSPRGRQPMESVCGRYVLVYNGELYNFRALRQTLESLGRSFRGDSDTEVLLEAIARWGMLEALRHFRGMFALAVWDRRERCLTLARDAIGIKPLFYGWGRGSFLFASELKAIREHPSFVGEINRQALTLFLRHGYIPAPHSIYRNFFKLPPGCLLTVKSEHVGQNVRDITPSVWWSLSEVVSQGAREPFQGSPEQAVRALDRQLRESIRSQMVSDVPLGALLSGGIDSSTVVALMQAESDRPIRTFTIGFEEQSHNEACYARAVAEHLGTDHTECYVTAAEARDVIPHLAQWYDEPFADSSQIPTALVARIARRHVSVCLSGDGGDELFCGYDRYEVMPQRWRAINRWPHGVRRVTARVARMVADRLPLAIARRKLKTLAEFAALQNPLELYTRFNAHWRDAQTLVVPDDRPPESIEAPIVIPEPILDHFPETMMYLDAGTYLPDDILVKVDRASMAVGLEVRVPLLDQQVVELAWRLTHDVKVRDRQPKWVLRQVLDRYVPRRLTDRPKMGFGVPIDSWLRGPLRDWAEELLSVERLRSQGLLHPEPIRARWREHLTGRYNWQYLLWDVLMFQAWLDETAANAS